FVGNRTGVGHRRSDSDVGGGWHVHGTPHCGYRCLIGRRDVLADQCSCRYLDFRCSVFCAAPCCVFAWRAETGTPCGSGTVAMAIATLDHCIATGVSPSNVQTVKETLAATSGDGGKARALYPGRVSDTAMSDGNSGRGSDYGADGNK